jgi:hypothetical protein
VVVVVVVVVGNALQHCYLAATNNNKLDIHFPAG